MNRARSQTALVGEIKLQHVTTHQLLYIIGNKSTDTQILTFLGNCSDMSPNCFGRSKYRSLNTSFSCLPQKIVCFLSLYSAIGSRMRPFSSMNLCLLCTGRSGGITAYARIFFSSSYRRNTKAITTGDMFPLQMTYVWHEFQEQSHHECCWTTWKSPKSLHIQIQDLTQVKLTSCSWMPSTICSSSASVLA